MVGTELRTRMARALERGLLYGPAALLILAIVLPYEPPPTRKERLKRSEADMGALARARRSFRGDPGACPPISHALSPASTLEVSLAPRCLRLLPGKDGWGREHPCSPAGDRFLLVSLGGHGLLHEGDHRALPACEPEGPAAACGWTASGAGDDLVYLNDRSCAGEPVETLAAPVHHGGV